LYVGAASQGMTDDHCVVPLRRQRAVCLVGQRDIVEIDSRLERKAGDNGNVLIWDQMNEWVFSLVFGLDAVWDEGRKRVSLLFEDRISSLLG
jgi:hypothetical protein